MKHVLSALVLSLCSTLATAQTLPTANPGVSKLAWDQSANDLAQASGAIYKHYDDGSAAVTFSGVACAGSSSPFVCQVTFPPFAVGNHNIAVSATFSGTEYKSAALAFNVPPAFTPTNLRIIGSLLRIFDGFPTIDNSLQDSDANPVELGVRFQSEIAGAVAGVGFLKTTNNTGMHVGNLWTRGGTLLATSSFVNETAHGWQYAYFSQPVPIAANRTYIASYFARFGHYASVNNAFVQASDNAPLHALADGFDGPNGLYVYSTTSAFPTQTYQSTNYFVDVLFSGS